MFVVAGENLVDLVVQADGNYYPAPGGKGIIPVLFSGIYDPDGYFIEINKLLGQAAGTEAKK